MTLRRLVQTSYSVLVVPLTGSKVFTIKFTLSNTKMSIEKHDFFFIECVYIQRSFVSSGRDMMLRLH